MSKEVEFKNRDRFIQLGIAIAALRKMRGMSQEKLAELSNVSRSHISAIEAPGIVRPYCRRLGHRSRRFDQCIGIP